MCYSGTCPHERWSGECGRRKGQLCPESFETDQEYWDALEEVESEKANYLYECEKGRRMGL